MNTLTLDLEEKPSILNHKTSLYKVDLIDELTTPVEKLKAKQALKSASKEDVIQRMLCAIEATDIEDLIEKIGMKKTSIRYHRWINKTNPIYGEIATSSIYKKLLGKSKKVETMEDLKIFLNAILDIYPEYKDNKNIIISLSTIEKAIDRIKAYRENNNSEKKVFENDVYINTIDQDKEWKLATQQDAINLMQEKLGADNIIALIEKIGDFHNTAIDIRKDNKISSQYGNRTISEINKKITGNNGLLKTVDAFKSTIEAILDIYPQYKTDLGIKNSLIALDYKNAWKMASREESILWIQQALEAEGIVDMIKKINRLRTNLQIYKWRDKASPKYGKQTRRAVYKKLTGENGRFNNTEEVYKSIQGILDAYPEYKEDSIVKSILHNLIKKIEKTQGKIIILD